ncbi:LexA family protein [Chenggangzhangella methanolivorans]
MPKKRGRAAKPRAADHGDLPNRIRELREAEGLSMAQLGARMGDVEASTINKLEKGDTLVNTRWMKRLADALRVDPIEILFAQPKMRRVKVVGAVQAGVFVEAIHWPHPDDVYEVAVPDAPELADIRLEGYEIRGPSMNKVYPEGSVVVVASIFSSREQLVSGARYVVERIRPDGEREGTCKLFEIDAAGRRWLIPESFDRSFQPIPLDDDAFENGELVQAIGRVMWSVKRETPDYQANFGAARP